MITYRGIRFVNGVVIAHCAYTHTRTPNQSTASNVGDAFGLGVYSSKSGTVLVHWDYWT